MSQAETRSTKILFRDWRQGDAEAGQLMAQRFADWYYAVATSRLGESGGSAACQEACGTFGQGVVQISDSRALIPWAHNIIQETLKPLGGRRMDGDEPNAYTGNQSPKALLARARGALAEDVSLLESVYRGGSTTNVEPIPVLEARYRVKKWLRDTASIPFEIAPDKPILDYAPMPLYESGRMATPEEETSFEQYMISDINLCKDIAEFAHFAMALRGGIPATAPAAASKKASPDAPRTESSGASTGAVAAAAGGGLLIFGGIALLALVALVALAYVFFA